MNNILRKIKRGLAWTLKQAVPVVISRLLSEDNFEKISKYLISIVTLANIRIIYLFFLKVLKFMIAHF